MNVLVTGAGGFLGRNLLAALRENAALKITAFDVDSDGGTLESACADCDFVFHLAGVNRPPNEADFQTDNADFTARLLELLEQNGNRAPVLFSSSIQAGLDNPYGASKRRGEEHVFAHAVKSGSEVYVYRLPGVFGKWCRPNYNSVVATFCHNIAHDLPIAVNDPAIRLRLVYIDDVVRAFTGALAGVAEKNGDFCVIPTEYGITLGELAEKLRAFRAGRSGLCVPPLETALDRALYATWLSYLPTDGFSYFLDLKTDNRGCLAEFIKSAPFGQIFISKTKPGITRGNHWHHTKCEKFLVLHGEGLIRFREIGSEAVLSYPVSGERPEVVDIPPGYTHSLTNTGDGELITLFWADEIFDPQNADTFFLEV